MTNAYRNLFFAVAFFCFLLTSPNAFSQKAASAEQEIISQLDNSFNAFFPADAPGGAVLVVKDGKTLLRKGYGLADAETKLPTSPEHIYKIGSITKQFTAAAILMLEEEGKLSVTDPLSKYLPDFPNAEKVTLEQLLNHTSGVRNYTDNPSWQQTMQHPVTLEELIGVFKNEPLDFEPGTSFRYSNSGYVLLGAVIEKISGMRYEAFIEKKVLAKAGLKNTFYGRDNVAVKNAVTGFTRSGDTYTQAKPLSMTQPHAAGALISNVDDLYKWNKAVFSGKIIGKASMEKAFKNYSLPSGTSIGYGYGWAPATVLGMKTIGHGGGINGFRSYAVMAPDQNIFVVLLTNNETLQPDFTAIKALAIAAGAYKEEKPIPLSTAELEKYVGVYPVDETSSRTIFIEDGKLFSQRTGNPAFELINVAKDEFLYKNSFSRAVFKMEGNKAVGMHFGETAGERTYFAKSDQAVPAPKKVVTLTEAQLKKLEGTYELAPNFAIVVTLVGNQLQAQATGQQAFEIFPTSEYNFFLKVVDAQIEFQKGGDGNITGLVLLQNGQRVPGKKIASNK